MMQPTTIPGRGLRPGLLQLALWAAWVTFNVSHTTLAAEVSWPFFAMQTATRTLPDATADSQVRLVKELGYDGIGAVPPAELEDFARACDRHQLRLCNSYFTLDIHGTPPIPPALQAQLAPLKGREAILWVGLTSTQYAPSDKAGDPAALKLLGDLADLADALAARVAIYPHAGFWVERTEDAVRLATQLNRTRVGVTFNLCHFLKVDEESRLEAVLRSAKDRLWVVSLNGADSGRRGGDWKELIQTLDRGTFDNTRLLRALRVVGFKGQVGFQGYGIEGDPADNLTRTMSAWRTLNARLTTAGASEVPSMTFVPDGEGGFMFDIGVMTGRLHAKGRSLGLTEVMHQGTQVRLDKSNGLLSHYRVFTRGVRHGGGAWDWASTAKRLDPVTVEVQFADAPERPFTMRALYRLAKPSTIEVTTEVKARNPIEGFEVFLASYFNAAFTNAAVMAKVGGTEDLVEATPERGDWQMYPRDAAARALAQDGRWKLEPNPVDWKFPFELAGPKLMAQRAAPGAGLSAILTASSRDCFAVAMPQQTEGHHSMYLSLFGRPVAAGETVSAKVQLLVGPLAKR